MSERTRVGRSRRVYLVALAATAVMVLLRWLLDPWLGFRLPFVMAYGAVAISAFHGGARPALLATLVGYLACHFLFVAPRDSAGGPTNALGFVVYLLAAVLIIGFGVSMRRSRRLAEKGSSLVHVTLSAIGDAVVTTDAEGRVTLLNPVGETLVGTTNADVVGRHFDEVLHLLNEQTRERIENPIARVLVEGKIVGLGNHTVLVARDGTERPIDDSAAPVRDADGKVVGAVMVFRDVTERRRAEQEVRRAEEKFRLMANAAPVLIWLCDAGKRCTWFNKTWLDFVGRPLERELGTCWTENVHEEDLERHLADYRAAFDARQPFTTEYRLRRRDGEYRWILESGAPLLGSHGEFTGYIGSCIDITDRRAAERALAERARLLDLSHDAIFVRDLRYRITYWNRGAEEMYGWRAEEVLGKVAQEVLRTEFFEPFEDILRQLEQTGRWSGELVHATRGGARVHVSSRWTLERDTDGRPVCLLEINNDITELKEAEAEKAGLLQSEREARATAERASLVKDEFLATLSHELRTPSYAILGWSRLIEKNPTDQKTVAEGVQVIARNAKIQSDLISDLLDMSRIVSGKMRLEIEDVDVASVIGQAIDAVQPAADAKQIAMESGVLGTGVVVRGDPMRLQQIVWNLLSNAVKYTPKGGSVHVSAYREGSSARIGVRDTGKGIAPELLPVVFERFRQGETGTTRGHGGLGLGLAIAKELVQLHGGNIRAESPGEGKGSTFTVELPIAAARTSGPARADGATTLRAVADVHLTGVRVLAVDDEPDARGLLERVLADYEAEVFVASSAAEALKLLEGDLSPHVILCDIGMPGMDGLEFIRRVRRAGLAVPAVAITAFARSEDRTKALVAGYHGHLTKPVEPAELVATVSAWARAHHSPGTETPGLSGGEEAPGRFHDSGASDESPLR